MKNLGGGIAKPKSTQLHRTEEGKVTGSFEDFCEELRRWV